MNAPSRFGGAVAECTIRVFGPQELWMMPVEELLARFGTSAAGLDSTAVRSRIGVYGRIEATTAKRRPLVLQFLARFRNPLIIILLAASALSGLAGDTPSFVIIATIVLLSISFDFIQEVRAQNAVEALRRSVAEQASVR